MRAWTMAVSLLALSACGDSGDALDMSVDPDIGDSVPDMPALTCASYVQCLNACFGITGTTTTQSDAEACVTAACDSRAPVTIVNPALTKDPTATPGSYDAARLCYEHYCIGNFDMPYACGVDAKGNFTEKDGTGLVAGGACTTCLDDASVALYGGTCTSATSTDCSTNQSSNILSQCGDAFMACTAH